jgi:methylated-DNA-protein-cysteine methyltransferase related protein
VANIKKAVQNSTWKGHFLTVNLRNDPEKPSRSSKSSTSPFVMRVFDIVRQIPSGKVTTYGRIARAAGATRSARMVGWALHHCPYDVSEVAHRVVNRNGELTGGWAWGHPVVMRSLLEDEGITFIDEFQVNLERHLWEPDEADFSPHDPDLGNYPPPTK